MRAGVCVSCSRAVTSSFNETGSVVRAVVCLATANSGTQARGHRTALEAALGHPRGRILLLAIALAHRAYTSTTSSVHRRGLAHKARLASRLRCKDAAACIAQSTILCMPLLLLDANARPAECILGFVAERTAARSSVDAFPTE